MALLDLDRWNHPTSKRERELLREVEALSFRTIERAPKHIMEYCLMEPQECHKNAWGYCENDPGEIAQVVSGWWRKQSETEDPVYSFHSVVQNPSGLFCVTPHNDEDFLDFAPDPAIQWFSRDGMRFHLRDDEPVPYNVRANPDQVIAKARLVKSRLLSGMNPWEALNIG